MNKQEVTSESEDLELSQDKKQTAEEWFNSLDKHAPEHERLRNSDIEGRETKPSREILSHK